MTGMGKMQIPESIMEPVMEYFENDLDKISTWINTDNPMLGGKSPCWMLLNDKQDKLQKFIDDAVSLNGGSYNGE